MTDSNNLVMPVSPYGGNGGFGGFGGDWGWIILLLLCAGGGWGFGGFGGGGLAADGAMLYPWMNQADITTSGFQNLQTNNAVSSLQNSVTSGFGDVQNALCGGFAGVNASIANGFAQSEIAANSRQMANMQQTFDLSRQFSDCCCENRLANCQTQNVIQSEGSATRFADANNTRDILENCNRNNQAILDKLCQLELDAKNDKIADLERQVAMASLSASQTAQTAKLIADNTAQTQYIVNRVAPYPIPSYTVPNPFVPAAI